MRRELEIIGERKTSVNMRTISRNVWARFRTLTGAGVSLGFVLFVALTTVTLMDRGSNFARASWRGMWNEEKPVRNLLIPVMPSTRNAQPYRPRVSGERPADDYQASRERRMLMNDLWGRFNQTLSAARNLAR